MATGRALQNPRRANQSQKLPVRTLSRRVLLLRPLLIKQISPQKRKPKPNRVSDGARSGSSQGDPKNTNLVFFRDNLDILESVPDQSVDLVYIDPPFNTGKRQVRSQLRTVASPEGSRVGFGGKRYETVRLSSRSFEDAFDDFLGFLEPRLRHVYRILKPSGSFYFHIDYREVHYCKVLIDQIFGRECFLNEIIWAYDYGARSKNKWPTKHDNLLFYVKDPKKYLFNTDEVDRIPYMSPELVGPEKVAAGKLPTDTWWHTIVSPTGREKLGYPTQKPMGILSRIVLASSPQGGHVMDFFAGSGTTGAVARNHGRRFTLVDNNPEAIEVMKRRFENCSDVQFL